RSKSVRAFCFRASYPPNPGRYALGHRVQWTLAPAARSSIYIMYAAGGSCSGTWSMSHSTSIVCTSPVARGFPGGVVEDRRRSVLVEGRGLVGRVVCHARCGAAVIPPRVH